MACIHSSSGKSKYLERRPISTRLTALEEPACSASASASKELKGKLVNLYSDGKNVEVSTAVQIVFNDNMKGL